MPPRRPQHSPPKRPQKKIKVLQIKQSQQKSLFSEYFYGLLVVLVCITTAALWALGYRFDEAAVIALWIGAILFVARQIKRYMKGETGTSSVARKAEARAKPLSSLPKKYTPPALPRVSKDFSPMPPAGDKRYPPPSPFIRPPK